MSTSARAARLARRATRRSVGARWRWRLALRINRLPGQCWTDPVSWALPWAPGPRLPWAPVTPRCTASAASDPEWRCYCGQVGADGKPWRGETS